MSFRPRESFDRSRRPSGASGGGAGGALGIFGATGKDLGRSTGPRATGASSTTSCKALAGRGRLRSGFACFATLSHSSASSRVSARLRRDTGGGSRLRGRFIGDDDGAGDAASGAAFLTLRLRVLLRRVLPSDGPQAAAPPAQRAEMRQRRVPVVQQGPERQSLQPEASELLAVLSVTRSCQDRPIEAQPLNQPLLRLLIQFWVALSQLP